jgi:hypothetical protein
MSNFDEDMFNFPWRVNCFAEPVIGRAFARPPARNDGFRPFSQAYFFAYDTPIPARTSAWMP